MDSGFKALMLACLFWLLWEVRAFLKCEVIVYWTEFPLWEWQRAKDPNISFPCSIFQLYAATVVLMSVALYSTSEWTQQCFLGYFFLPSRWIFRFKIFFLLEMSIFPTGEFELSPVPSLTQLLKQGKLELWFLCSSLLSAVWILLYECLEKSICFAVSPKQW